jgi:transposase
MCYRRGQSLGKGVVRIPHPSVRGRRTSKVWDVPATCAAVSELAEQLLAERVERVTVESTSDYWRIWLYLLEAAGLGVQLVNAHVKNVPGRPKTDLADADWLVHLLECGLLRDSFIPPADIKAARDVIRYRTKLTESRTSELQRLGNVLQDAGIKIDSVASRHADARTDRRTDLL